MKRIGKITKQIRESVDKSVNYLPLDGIKKLREVVKIRKCRQSISIDIALKNKKKQELPNNYTFNVPNGIRKSARILVVLGFIAGEKLKADNKYNDEKSDCFVKIGTIDDVKKIVSDRCSDFKYIVTNKENLPSIAAYAKDIAALKLMPSAKNGTVVEDVWAGVRGIIEGSKIAVKKDSAKHLRFKIAGFETSDEGVRDNIIAICGGLIKDVKSMECIASVQISSTHGPAIKLNMSALFNGSSF